MSGGLNKDGGISFERKRNFGKEEPKVEESEIIEKIYNARFEMVGYRRYKA